MEHARFRFDAVRHACAARPGPDPVWSNRCMCILGLFQGLDTMAWPMSRPMPWGATTNSLHGPGHQYVSWSLPLGGSQSCVTPGLLATCDRACFFQLRGSGILVALAHACRQAPRHQARVVSRHGTQILTWKCHRRFGVRYRQA